MPQGDKNETSHRFKAVRSVSSGVHTSLLQILQGEAIPKKNRSLYDIAAYRIKNKPGLASVCNTRNPLTGRKELRVLIQHKGGHRTILLKNCEVKVCIKNITQNTKVLEHENFESSADSSLV